MEATVDPCPGPDWMPITPKTGSLFHAETQATADRHGAARIDPADSVENPLWGAPRIHGELLKLGFEVAQSSVAKYMVKGRGPPSQGWRTFLRNHAPDIAAMDLFVVPTIGFDLLYAFVIIRLDRRDLSCISVTANPTAEWVARQITEAFPWDEAPHYLIRDRDRIYTQRRHAPIARHGHPGQAYRTSLALAKWLCRTADRIDPA